MAQSRSAYNSTIAPPLPKKYASPLKGGWCFFSLARGQDSVLRRKQVQPSGGDASRREFAARQRERQRAVNPDDRAARAKAILPTERRSP